MINELQTLLLNRNPDDQCFSPLAGDYASIDPDWLDSRLFIEPDYQPKSLSQAETEARQQLFGSQPDYHYLSYRLAQLHALLFCGKYTEAVAVFDSRRTSPESWAVKTPPWRTSYSTVELGRFSGFVSANDLTGVSLFSAKFRVTNTAYQVVESSRPLPNTSLLFGQSLPGETWWLDQVPGTDPVADLIVSDISPPSKSLRQAYDGIVALTHELSPLLSNLTSTRRAIVTALLAESQPWYDQLAGWAVLLAETAGER